MTPATPYYRRAEPAAALRIVHCDFGRGWRGGQQQLLLLAQALSRLGCSQTVIARDAEVAARLRDAGFAVEAPALAGLRALRRADVMHAHDGRAQGWTLLAGWGSRGLRVLSRRVAFPVKSQLARAKLRRMDLVIAVSSYVRGQVLAAGVPAERGVVIADAIDFESLPTGNATRLRERLGCSASNVVLVALGAFTPEKGIADLIAALALLPARCRLVLGGDGPERAALERQAHALGVRDRLIFAGDGGIGAAQLVAAGDALVMPSRIEGLGSAALIAMALGKPVVATTAGGIPELVQHEHTGLLTPPQDAAALAAAVARLVADSALAGRLAAAARQVVADGYNSALMGQKTLAAYRAALARRGGAEKVRCAV